MAKILKKEETINKKKVINITKTPSESIQNYKLLPKCMIPRNKKFINTPG